MRGFTILILAVACGLAGCSSGSRGRTAVAASDYAAPGVNCAPPSCRVPIYETVMEPVYEKRTVPVCKVREVPVYAYHEEPVYTDRWVPVQGHRTRPIMVRRKVPVDLDYQGRCGMETKTLYCAEKCVQVGVERVPATLGHQLVREKTGTKRVRVLMGYKRVSEPNGCKTECVEVGERPVQRICGWKTVPAGSASR